MSGRDDQDGLPPAARRYETEERELLDMVQGWRHGQRDWESVLAWFNRTLAQHRMEARSQALTESWRGSWWDRNWFGIAFLALTAGAMLVIGLVNGWS